MVDSVTEKKDDSLFLLDTPYCIRISCRMLSTGTEEIFETIALQLDPLIHLLVLR
jgi:hypothetical protein